MLLKQLFLFLKPITVITVDPSCLLVLLELCQNVCIITLQCCKVAEGCLKSCQAHSLLAF